MKKTKNKYMYGKFHHEKYEFTNEIHSIFNDFLGTHSLDMKINNDIVDLRNHIKSLISSWIGQKKIEDKFGIKIPIQKSTHSVECFLERQARSSLRKYIACEVCGEKRISNWCHIIPRSEGGTDNKENYIFLCPTHHHLFDHNRLSECEWKKIDFSKKSEAARAYSKKIRLPLMKKHWSVSKK